MHTYPQTKKEAQKTRYGIWGGNSGGTPYQDDQCAAEVADRSNPRWTHYHQCHSKPGYGPCGLYCKTHAKKAQAQSADPQIENWYEVDAYSGDQIAVLKVVSSTEKTLTLKGGYTRRKDDNMFRTAEEALDCIIKRTKDKIESSKRTLESLGKLLCKMEKAKTDGKPPFRKKY